MIDVFEKDVTRRCAKASGKVLINSEVYSLIKEGKIKKGDPLIQAKIAGIIAAKKTFELIPMCHPIPLEYANVNAYLSEKESAVIVESEIRNTAKTGVEMEAIVGVSIGCATIYDMCKGYQKDMVISDITLDYKSGGIHGDYEREKK